MAGRAQGTGGADAGASARCVVLHRPGQRPPGALLEALRRQGLDPIEVPDRHLALAEACRPGPETRRVVLFASPDAGPDLGRLARAVERFVPGGVAWIHEPGANPPVRAFVERASPRSTPETIDPPPRARPASGSPMLRLIDPGPDGARATEEEEPTAERLLTSEELSMLLAEGRENP